VLVLFSSSSFFLFFFYWRQRDGEGVPEIKGLAFSFTSHRSWW
jgi:hypothetical protein